MIARKIEPKMIDFLDKKLAKVGMAQKAIDDNNPRLLFIEAARVCVGIREEGGNNSGPLVELIQETIGSHSQEAWCMALLQTLIAYVEYKLAVVSPIFPSEHCLTVWDKTDKKARVQSFPLPGAIIIWQHGTSQSGHTGVFLEVLLDHNSSAMMLTIEGNTTKGIGPKGEVVRDGGGVYVCERNMKSSGDMHVLGFLKPFEYKA